jgi:hypothetical protein
MFRFEEIVKMLGHQGRDIDILKMDIEGSEWDVLPQLLDSVWFREARVKQLVLEVHFRPDAAKNLQPLRANFQPPSAETVDSQTDSHQSAIPSSTPSKTGVSVKQDAALLARLKKLGYHLFNRDENWRHSPMIEVDGHAMHQCLELSYMFLGPSAEAGVLAPYVQPLPTWRMAKRQLHW